jgi:hypothetical protein
MGPVPPPAPGYHPHPYMPPRTHGDGRNEIILVSDDRVMALRFASAIAGAAASDSASLSSLPIG